MEFGKLNRRPTKVTYMDIIDCDNKMNNDSQSENGDIDTLFEEAVNESSAYTNKVVQHALTNTIDNNQSQFSRWVYNTIFDSSPENYLEK